MTRSRRSSGKLTTKQLQKEVVELQGIVNQMINAVTNDMARVNAILFGILKQNNWLIEMDCAECGQDLVLPKLDALPLEQNCPSCGFSLDIDPTQSKLEDFSQWDNGEEE